MLNERFGVDHEKVMDIDLRIHYIFKEIKPIAESFAPTAECFHTGHRSD